MIRKLMSAGITDADLAALDAAISHGIPHGGWTPATGNEKRKVLPSRYELSEMPTDDRALCIERNVSESGGVLLFYREKPTTDLAWAKRLALVQRKQFLGIDPGQTRAAEAADLIYSWTVMQHLEVVYFIGPVNTPGLDVCLYTYQAIEMALMQASMDRVSQEGGRFQAIPVIRKVPPPPPGTVAEAVERLVEELPLKEKSRLANCQEAKLVDFNDSLGKFIRHAFHLNTGNPALVKSCLALTGGSKLDEKGVSALILSKLHRKLRETHRLRRVK
jgi:hypothetical protein